MLTQERLKEVLEYDAGTGLFRWKEQIAKTVKIGEVAGSRTVQDYIDIKIDGRTYKAHRLVWLYTHGYFPENMIDHINRARLDNRLCNLRESSRACNAINSRLHTNNTSGVKGVHYNSRIKKWVAQASVGNKRKWLGNYQSMAEAVYARYAAEQCLGYAGYDTNSTALQYIRTR